MGCHHAGGGTEKGALTPRTAARPQPGHVRQGFLAWPREECNPQGIGLVPPDEGLGGFGSSEPVPPQPCVFQITQRVAVGYPPLIR